MQWHVFGDTLNAVACIWWLSKLLQTLKALVYTGTCASKQTLFWCSMQTDTRLNMCVLMCIVMLDLLFCSTVADFTFTSWFLCRHGGNGEIFPSMLSHLTSPAHTSYTPWKSPQHSGAKLHFSFLRNTLILLMNSLSWPNVSISDFSHFSFSWFDREWNTAVWITLRVGRDN